MERTQEARGEGAEGTKETQGGSPGAGTKKLGEWAAESGEEGTCWGGGVLWGTLPMGSGVTEHLLRGLPCWALERRGPWLLPAPLGLPAGLGVLVPVAASRCPDFWRISRPRF